MFEYVSQIHAIKGPGIGVKVFLSQEQIFEIQLTSAEKNSLSWQIFSEKSNPKIEKKISDWMHGYASKESVKIQLPLDLTNLPPYTLLVLQHVHKIPFGKTLSYQQVAQITGKPKAARAVGNACGRNPFPLIIPCHRVLASGGAIGGYTGEAEVKKRLLAFEAL